MTRVGLHSNGAQRAVRGSKETDRDDADTFYGLILGRACRQQFFSSVAPKPSW